MAEHSFLDPSPFDSNPSMDTSYPLFFDSDLNLDDLPLPDDFAADFAFHDLDISTDFPIEDLLRSPEDQPFPPSSDGSPLLDSNDGSGVSSSRPASGHQSSDLSGNNGSSSPDSGHSAACSPDSGNCSGVSSQEVKLEEENSSRWNLKRKQDREDGCPNPNPNPNPRSSKYQRSEQENCASAFNTGSEEEEEKKKARLIRNRESAQLSRQRKKHYVEELEEKMKLMHSTINELNTKISYIMAENASLRQQLGGSSAKCPPSGVYPVPPMAPMHFPWIPGYALRPQGSQIPLVPIPKLKPQQPASAPRAKKSESKKNESRVKKVASVSLLGLLFVLLFFRSVVPGVIPSYGGDRDDVFGGLGVAKGTIFGHSKGRILSVSGRGSGLNSTDEIGLCNGKMGFGEGGVDKVTSRCEPRVGGSVFKVKQNSSETLPALLYVPRNGKHVKINGNLIINSVLASEKAMARTKSRDQLRQSSGKEGKETGLAIPDNVALALALSKSGREVDQHSNSYRSSGEHQRALASDSEDAYGDNSKSIPVDGPLHQWFREGMAGPVLSSGMCTEVFGFDVSPASAPGGIIPATKIVNASVAKTTEKLPPSAHPRKVKNRRIMYPQPIPLTGITLNDTKHFAEPSESSKLHDNKSVSSMVVSVLADPREAGDAEGDARISPKSLSRIFVVVLLDGVKYVTYSCGLPFKSSGPHLVD